MKIFIPIDSRTIIFQPYKECNKAIIGYNPETKQLFYSMLLLIEIFMKTNDWSWCESIKWIEYNMIQEQENWPIVIDDLGEM